MVKEFDVGSRLEHDLTAKGQMKTIIKQRHSDLPQSSQFQLNRGKVITIANIHNLIKVHTSVVFIYYEMSYMNIYIFFGFPG